MYLRGIERKRAMHELIDILLEIKNELSQINERLDNIGGFHSITDVCHRLEDISGH